jgi:hypothetical protein
VKAAAFVSLTVLVALFSIPVSAQLVGTDTAPGSSCAGFPDGATRVTADADLDGEEVTLVCDGTTWNAVAGGGEVEQVGGMASPSWWEAACVQRTASTSLGIITVSCNAGEIMTGGGCGHSSTTLTTEDSRPSAADTWSCEWSNTGATGTAYAICCTY